MARAVWSPKAESEPEEIVYYIRDRDGRPETARRIGQEVESVVKAYSSGLYRGHSHPEAPDGWFYFRHKRWLIFYQPHPEGIEVMRVIDGSRDLPQQFEESRTSPRRLRLSAFPLPVRGTLPRFATSALERSKFRAYAKR